MKRPYLIQRMIEKRNPPENPSLDELYSMGYMGSSEFEWGALPKALKVLTKNIDNLIIEKTKIKNYMNEKCFIIGDKETIDEYKLIIGNLFNRKFILKERLGAEYILTGKGSYSNSSIFKPFYHPSAWWDIDNHIMFTFKGEKAIKLLEGMKIVRKKKEKLKAEGWY